MKQRLIRGGIDGVIDENRTRVARVTVGRTTIVLRSPQEFGRLVWAGRFERPTRAFQVRYSTKLSYAQTQTSDRVITRVAVVDVVVQ